MHKNLLLDQVCVENFTLHLTLINILTTKTLKTNLKISLKTLPQLNLYILSLWKIIGIRQRETTDGDRAEESNIGSQNLLYHNDISLYILERCMVWCLNNPYIQTIPKGQNKFQQYSYINNPEHI
ncbi:hypothetical protein HJG60_011289 [Phyllostomus discolor]|uniref:Uncharacterized protein n=1 Tax=Phyllostomus discolor TaxID=89673 RepID=A0A834E7P3_9CHIR|nr:hypothetical protein HJG60_011289 [Phyllostomus discolor]